MRALISALLVAVLAGPAFALTSASNRTDGGVTIRPNVAAGTVIDPGDAVSFQYQSARKSAVLVFDINTQGYVSLLTEQPVSVTAHDTRPLPEDNSQLFAEGQPGVEFVFAVAVDDPGAFDSDAMATLRDGSRRINGDPFVAANMITAEIVRNISQQTVFMGYTYFYVTNRVDYPCYLCGTCDGSGRNECEGYHVAQNFDRGVSLVYPLARGYDTVNMTASSSPQDTTGDIAMPENQDNVNFYPYGSEVHYADPVAVNSWYNWGWYDPYFMYYPYSYPYCGYPYGFTIGIGWGWGWGWGFSGYYCGGCYNPYWGCGGYGGYYPGYGPVYSGNVVKFKSQYKSGGANYTANTLAGNRSYAMKHDGSLQIASKSTRSWSAPTPYRSKTFTTSYPMTQSRHFKTTITGSRYVAQGAWAGGRGPGYGGATPYHSMYHNNNGTAGRTVQDRGGYSRSKSGTPYYGGGTTRMKGGWSPSYNAPGGNGYSSPVMRSYKGSQSYSPGYRGWGGGWGGGHGGFSGGAMRGGGGGGGGGHGRGR